MLMPKRKTSIVPGEFYHVYNKSVGSEKIFLSEFNIKQALKRVHYYKFKRNLKYVDYVKIKENRSDASLSNKQQDPLVIIYAYSIMPNHYHFVVKELKKEGLRSFISNFQMSFAWFYNSRNKRSGSVFQGRFKAKHIQSIEQLLHLIRYVHLNPVTAYLCDFKDLSNSLRTSYYEYVTDNHKNSIVDTKFVMKHFNSIKDFKVFHKNQVEYQRSLASIKKLLVD